MTVAANYKKCSQTAKVECVYNSEFLAEVLWVTARVFLSQTSGTGIMSFASDGFGPRTADDVGSRKNGVLIANAQGKAVGFALCSTCKTRGRMMVKPNQMVYEGMVVGIHVTRQTTSQ